MATAEANSAAVAAIEPITVPTIHRIRRASIKAISTRTRSISTAHVRHLRSGALYFDPHVRQFRADSRESVFQAGDSVIGLG